MLILSAEHQFSGKRFRLSARHFLIKLQDRGTLLEGVLQVLVVLTAHAKILSMPGDGTDKTDETQRGHGPTARRIFNFARNNY